MLKKLLNRNKFIFIDKRKKESCVLISAGAGIGMACMDILNYNVYFNEYNNIKQNKKDIDIITNTHKTIYILWLSITKASEVIEFLTIKNGTPKNAFVYLRGNATEDEKKIISELGYIVVSSLKVLEKI